MRYVIWNAQFFSTSGFVQFSRHGKNSRFPVFIFRMFPMLIFFFFLIISLELENRILRWIMRVVREALLSQDKTIDLGYKIGSNDISDLTSTTKQLSYAVVKVWAQMFESCNSPWPVVVFIGRSLNCYADINNSNLANESTAIHAST